jgi:glc operon protein GlcG
MHRLLLLTGVFYCAVSLSLAAHAQQQPAPPPTPPYGPPISVEQAKKAVAAAVTEAKRLPYPSSFAVVGPAGNLIYFEAMDNAAYASADIAIAKAHTAAIFKQPTKAWFDRMESGHSYVMTLRPGMVAAAGGIPLIVDGKVVGAIGVSGAPSGEMDNLAARAGADALK